MRILVLGAGGREHALVWSLRRSLTATEIFCAPGNAGIAQICPCIETNLAKLPAMLAAVEETRPDLVVVGPEIPLAEGIVDALTALGIRVFGPTKAAAMLETSKAFAKGFMSRWNIPTANYKVCHSLAEARQALTGFPDQVVVKVDGLAAGKGVILCESPQEALVAVEEMFDTGLAGVKVEAIVLEEMLNGPEISFFAICDGNSAVRLAVAQDHKRACDGDTGPNTGGMGAYCTDDLVSEEMSQWILDNVARRVVYGMSREETPFIGVLFIGLMITPDGPKVLEFNTRFGDPETEAILLRLDTDLVTIFEAAVGGRIAEVDIRLKDQVSACVVLASGGYPGDYVTGKVIRGLETTAPDVQIFHSGTRSAENQIMTAGGRVLVVSALGRDLAESLSRCYSAIDTIGFEGIHFRRDIGWRALSNAC